MISVTGGLFKKEKRKPRRVKRRGDLEMTAEAKKEREYSACIFGNALNGEVYNPHENQLIAEVGSWVMIRRQLPPMEREMDQHITIGRVFWAERTTGTDEEGFNLKDGTYKVLCRSPFGELCLWPYEYIVLDATYLTAAWQDGALAFNPTGLSEAQFTDQMFYCMSRGIGRADAAVMCLGSLSGPIGWFEPAEEVVDYVSMFSEVGMITDTNRKRRSASRRARRSITPAPSPDAPSAKSPGSSAPGQPSFGNTGQS